jgi:hypothetical protein
MFLTWVLTVGARAAATSITVRSKVVFDAARAVLPEVFAILLLHLGNVPLRLV